MMSWVIFLRQFHQNASSYEVVPESEGYYGILDVSEGRVLLYKEPDEAVRYETEEAAEAALVELEEKFGIDRDDAEIVAVATDRTFDLRLGGDHHDDGVSVVEEGGKRFITVRNCGTEASDEVCNEVADRLIALLGKLNKRLRNTQR